MPTFSSLLIENYTGTYLYFKTVNLLNLYFRALSHILIHKIQSIILYISLWNNISMKLLTVELLMSIKLETN